MRAYPRVCGATRSPWITTATSEGLSPRVRGNLDRANADRRVLGPIPACAGQPKAGEKVAPVHRAYPRVCGATVPSPELRDDLTGLSPRVRGNLHVTAQLEGRIGPIPACAGQPACS